MHNWKALVRARLNPLPVDPARADEIVDELAQHVGDDYADLVASGMPDAEAVENALAPLADRARTLRIRTGYAQRNRISILIEDTGVGIEPERLPSLFTASITTKERGMGLGLSLCQMIVDRHNGQLSVSSDVGKGTRFEVTLPFDPTAPVVPPRVAAGSVNVGA